MGYQIFTDATADFSNELLLGLPCVEIIPMEVCIGSGVYTYGSKGNLTVKQFYRMQRYILQILVRSLVHIQVLGCLQ